jgi:hypothetical protein
MLPSKNIKKLVSSVIDDCKKSILPPEGGLDAIGQPVVPFVLIKGTRGYLERIVHQINGSYSNGWYDACAVMIRRLIEILIIEVFEKHEIADKIKNDDGDFFYLSDLVNITLSETKWNIGRNVKKVLPKLKNIGDKSAHSRRFIAIRPDIDKISSDLRDVIQELVFLANF